MGLFEKKVKCPNCEKKIPETALACPYCGKQFGGGSGIIEGIGAFLGGVGLGILQGLAGDDDD